MASAAVSGEVKRLEPTSEWMVANTGHSRAQILDVAVKNLVSMLCDLISYYNTHLEQSPPSELLIEAQELCIPMANNVDCLPLIEALLQHCSQGRWELPSSVRNQPLPTAPTVPLSQTFLERVTQLHKSGLRLSHKSLVVLWTAHPLSLQLELTDMAETCMMTSSEKAFLTCINGHDLVKACAHSSKLFDDSVSFLREMAGRDPEKSLFLHLFNHIVTRKRLQL